MLWNKPIKKSRGKLFHQLEIEPGPFICGQILSNHCIGPFSLTSIQQGVLVTSWRLYSLPQPLTKLIRIEHILVNWKTAL